MTDYNMHCIICGSNGKIKSYYIKGKIRYYVQCPVCGHTGSDGRREEDAMTYWEIANTPLSHG